MNNPYLSLITTVWRYGAPWRPAIVGYYIAYILATVILGFGPYAFGRAIDILQRFKADQLNALIFWLTVGVGVILLFWLFHGPARVAERIVALKIQHAFRLELYKQLSYLPLPWHQNHHSGEIITRLNRAAEALRQFAEGQFIYIETLVSFFVAIAFLLWISIPVGMLSLLISLIVTIVVLFFDRKLIPLWSSQNEIDNRFGAVLFDYMSNMTTIITLRLESLTRSNLYQRLQPIWPLFRKDTVLNEMKWFTMNLLLSAVQAIILIGYILHTIHLKEAIFIGLIVMMFRYQIDLSNVFRDLSMHYSELVRMDTDIKGLQPILDDIQKFSRLLENKASLEQWHTLDISQLNFNRENTSRHRIDFNNLAFRMHRGEKIALIGPSGCGKSTLLNLLGGLYTPSQVTLCIDNAYFNTLEPLKAITTLIPQEPELFENTIAFNITLDLPTTPDSIEHAMDLAGFLPVLNTLHEGLATDIREKGLNFSVGQKQRLALARGLFAARYSSLILMDEPTSSVDLVTEKKILSGVLGAFSNTAMIVSLHRLHLLPQFDTIIMLENGKIIARGSAKTLLQQPGPVKALWEAYSG